MTTSPAPLPELTGERIPADIVQVAEQAAGRITTQNAEEVIASTILAERERCAMIAKDNIANWHIMSGNPCKRIFDRILGGDDRPFMVVPSPSVSPSNQKQEG